MSADKYPSIFSCQMATIVYIFPNFQNCARCEKDLKDNKDNSLHLGRKYARIFVLGHYLFLVAHSFPRTSLSEDCSLLGTDNVRGQISEYICAPNGDYCLFIPCSANIESNRVIFRAFLFLVKFNFLYFGGVFDEIIIPFALVGYEIGYSQLGPTGLVRVGYLPSHIQHALME